MHIRYFIGYVYHICLQDTIQSTLSLCLRCQAMLLPMPLRPLLLTTRSGFTPTDDSPRFFVQRAAGLNTSKRHFMGGNSSADILHCHSGLALHAFVLFVNIFALISGGKVCCLFEPGVRMDSTLGGSQQALMAERHPHLSTDDKLCTLCVHYRKPSPFFAKTSPRITLPATPESLAQSTTAVTPAKNKPD